MTESSLITDELRKLVGVPGAQLIFEVEEGAIKRYAEAIGDPNPLYNDSEYAGKSKYGRLICPPGFTGWPVKGRMPMFEILDSLVEAGAPQRVLDGGIEFEFFVPIGAGDILVATSKIIDISERETKLGKMMFTIIETNFSSRNDDVAVRNVVTLMNY